MEKIIENFTSSIERFFCCDDGLDHPWVGDIISFLPISQFSEYGGISLPKSLIPFLESRLTYRDEGAIWFDNFCHHSFRTEYVPTFHNLEIYDDLIHATCFALVDGLSHRESRYDCHFLEFTFQHGEWSVCRKFALRFHIPEKDKYWIENVRLENRLEFGVRINFSK